MRYCSDTGRSLKRWRMPSGLTLLELLTVVALIAVLASLLLPAVQSAREAARRHHCVNNLGQLILAVQQYVSVHGVLPPGSVEEKGPILNQPKGYHHGWISQVLPYVGENVLYQRIDRSQSVYAKANSKARGYALVGLACPSEWGGSTGITAYAGVHHDVEAPIDVQNNGVLFLNSSIAYEDVGDGIAHTIFLGERVMEPADLGWISGTRATLRNTGLRLNAFNRVARGRGSSLIGWEPEPEEGMEPGMDSNRSSNAMNRTAMFGDDESSENDPIWALIDAELGPLESPGGQATPGNAPAPKRTLSLTGVGGFGSRHIGGANFAFGDGAVRFIAEEIPRNVYRRLAHRSDGDLLDVRRSIK